MTSDLARDEARAAALPRDYVQDIGTGPCTRNVCEACLHIFQGRPYRTACALCAPKEPHP